jgi:hypothetical protein
MMISLLIVVHFIWVVIIIIIMGHIIYIECGTM